VGVASIAPLGALVGFAPNMATALAVICVVAFLTQCWSTNMATLASEILPETATGTAVGMMGTAGSLGGALFSQVLGFLISHLGYASAFVAGACMHPIAATVLVLLLRRPDRSQPAC
jgi:ACS family hexuronate transporter-like MFS transporter